MTDYVKKNSRVTRQSTAFAKLLSTLLLLMLGGCSPANEPFPIEAESHAISGQAGQSYYYYSGSRRVAIEPVPDTWVLVSPSDHREQLAAHDKRFVPSGTESIATLEDGLSVYTIVHKIDKTAARSLHGTLGRAERIWRQGDLPIVPSGRVLLRFCSTVETENRRVILEQMRADVIESFPDGSLLVRVEGDSIAWANRLHESGLVEFGEPDLGRLYELRSPPEDQFYPRQWHLENTGQDGALAGADIDAEGAWELTTGTPDVVIAIIDTGVDPDHEDLDSCKLMEGYDALLDVAGVTDYDGHGTSCAGVAAARANNGVGVSGACPACRVLPVRIGLGWDASELFDTFAPQGGAIAFDSHVARAFFHAVDNGAWIISNSWGPVVGMGPQPLSSINESALGYAETNGRDGLGEVVLFAAGNEGAPVDLDGFASHEQVMAIGASNDQDRRSAYSNYGSKLSVVAPSSGISVLDGARTSGIWTTDISGPAGYNAPVGQRERTGDAMGHYTARFGGTSSATPLVAGIAGLVLSVDRSLTAERVRQLIESTAVKIDQAGGSYDADGFSRFYGHGRVDAAAAVVRALAERGEPEVGDACAGVCGGANPLCVEDAVFGDYCTHACVSDDDCPAAYSCEDRDEGRVCARPLPCAQVPELCNGVDDDGDGETDEVCGRDCTPGPPGSDEGRCAGAVLIYCDGGREVSVDCAALGATCIADGVPHCDFPCPEDSPPGEDAPAWCAGNTVVSCQYREFFGRVEFAGISVEGCAELCVVGSYGPTCECAGVVDVCDGNTRVRCVDGATRRVPCAGECDDSGGWARCKCETSLSCNGDRLSFCNSFGQTVEVDCPERCLPEAGEMQMPDCACAGNIAETGNCSPDDGRVTLCISGETRTFDCPETCGIRNVQTFYGENVERAVCTCADLPEEGICKENVLTTCPLGFRLETACPGSCGWVVDALSLEFRRGCLCAGMQAGVECDGGDIVACLSNGETVRIACSQIEPGTDTCVPRDNGGASPSEDPPIECISLSSPDGGTDGGADGSVDAGADSGGQDGTGTGGGGCGCRMASSHGSIGFVMLSLLVVVLAFLRRRWGTVRKNSTCVSCPEPQRTGTRKTTREAERACLGSA